MSAQRDSPIVNTRRLGVPRRHNSAIEEYSTPQGAAELILADTSIWIDHLRSGNKELRKHLNQGNIVIHPFIIAELALGLLEKRSLQHRAKTLALLDLLP